jgi:hypothetical protein
MPHTRNPLPIHLGEGTRRHPKLKDEGAPGGAGCRGACGPDCPSTCKVIGTYVERYEIGGTHYTIEFPDALLCGTHAGCRLHDNCFDGAVAGGEVDMGGPKHVACNWEALIKYGRSNTTSWARGGGPYDDWWYFVDSPRVVESSKAKRTAP